MKRIAFHHQKRLQLKGPTFAWTARRPPSQKESIMIFPLSFPASTTFDNSRILLQKDTLGRVSLSIYVFIGTKGALRLPTTYDIHPIPFHPSIHKASFIIWTGLGLIWVDLQWPPMTSNDSGVSGNSRSRPFPRMKASDSLSRIMGMDFFIPFPFPNFWNAFFHSLPVPELWE